MKVKKIIKNRYVLVSLVFVGYLMFFDQYNFRAQYRLMSELSQIRDEKEFYSAELTRDSITYHTLFNSKENLERFARERFKMKKANEDVFIIIKEK